MTNEKRILLLGRIDSRFIEEYHNSARAKSSNAHLRKWIALAVCFAAAVSAAFAAINISFSRNTAEDIYRMGTEHSFSSLGALESFLPKSAILYRIPQNNVSEQKHDLYTTENASLADSAQWKTLASSTVYENGNSLYIICIYNNAGKSDQWDVDMVFTKEATRTLTVGKHLIRYAHFTPAIDDYFYYAFVEADGVLYDIRTHSQDPNYIIEVLQTLFAP